MTDHDCDACPNNKGLELATAEVERLRAELAEAAEYITHFTQDRDRLRAAIEKHHRDAHDPDTRWHTSDMWRINQDLWAAALAVGAGEDTTK